MICKALLFFAAALSVLSVQAGSSVITKEGIVQLVDGDGKAVLSIYGVKFGDIRSNGGTVTALPDGGSRIDYSLNGKDAEQLKVSGIVRRNKSYVKIDFTITPPSADWKAPHLMVIRNVRVPLAEETMFSLPAEGDPARKQPGQLRRMGNSSLAIWEFLNGNPEWRDSRNQHIASTRQADGTIAATAEFLLTAADTDLRTAQSLRNGSSAIINSIGDAVSGPAGEIQITVDTSLLDEESEPEHTLTLNILGFQGQRILTREEKVNFKNASAQSVRFRFPATEIRHVYALEAILANGRSSGSLTVNITELPELRKRLNDPLDNVRAYTLTIGADGIPGPDYMPIGMRAGFGNDPQSARMVVHSGFNLFQSGWFVRPEDAGKKEVKAAYESSVLPELGMFDFTQVRTSSSLPSGEEGKSMGKLNAPTMAPGYGIMTPFLDSDGKASGGHNKSFSIFSPARIKYQMEAKEISCRLYGNAVPPGSPTIMWGMENEWEGHLDYSPEAKAAFAVWLKKNFNSINELNAAWGKNYKTYEEAAANPAKAEEVSKEPGAFLAWHTFQSREFTRFLSEMAHVQHNADPYKRPVVHKATQQSIEMPIVNRVRCTFDHEFYAELTQGINGGLHGVNAYGTGDRESYEINYIYNCIRQFDDSGVSGVMTPELNNHNGPGWQWAAGNWRLLNNGLRAFNFFCVGHKGAKNDYSTFGHISSETGLPRDKMYYAARFSHMIHRTEAFWKHAAPVSGLDKVAILLPRRDIQIASTGKYGRSKWSYPENNRGALYSLLRQQGYWVDIIPYGMLTPEKLAQYNALFLIGAEHLKKTETEAIRTYVEQGGTLIADERPGYYDELHRTVHRMDDFFGVRFGDWAETTYFDLGGRCKDVEGVGPYPLELKDAKTTMGTTDGKPLQLTRKHGKGNIVYFAMKLGSLHDREAMVSTQSTYVAENQNTADTGVDFVEKSSAKFRLSRWLGDELEKIGLRPAYRLDGDARVAVQPRLRLEQPCRDKAGNVMFAVATDAVRRPELSSMGHPGCEMEITLPGGHWNTCLFSPAEHAGLEPLQLTAIAGDRYRFRLPRIETAGMVYFLKDHQVLLGIPQIGASERAADGFTARISPNQSFTVNVQFVNPRTDEVKEGELRLLALRGWEVKPAAVATKGIKPGERKEFSFTVTPAPDARNTPDPELFPLVARWSEAGVDKAVCSVNVDIAR